MHALGSVWGFLVECYLAWRRNDLTWKIGVLSYATAISLLPLALVFCWIGGAVLDALIPHWIASLVDHGVPYLLPQIELLSETSLDGVNGVESLPTKPQIEAQIKRLLRAATSGQFGGPALGAFALFGFFFVLSVNRTMNDLWDGEDQPSEHPVYRFLYVLLCLVLLIAAGFFMPITYSTLSTVQGELSTWVQSWLGTLLPPILLWFVLTAFYAATPAPHVRYRACFAGGMVGMLALQINQSLANLYVYSVISAGYLYGVVGIAILALTGIYVFWCCVMLGAVIARVIDKNGD